jgi:hypothetical protein
LSRSSRTGVDPAGHAVLQGEGRPFFGATGMGVDVDQARSDDLAARVDRFAGVAGNVGLDRGDLAAGDRHVTDCIQSHGGIDDATALDEQVVARRSRVRDATDHRRACRSAANELTPVHHCRRPPSPHRERNCHGSSPANPRRASAGDRAIKPSPIHFFAGA